MKKFIVKFATVILYVLMVAYLSGFKIGLLLDWKALAAVFPAVCCFQYRQYSTRKAAARGGIWSVKILLQRDILQRFCFYLPA